jgi:hypothetical protein
MEVFTSIPARAIRPIMATKERELPVIQSAIKAPTIPKGITESTMIVLLKVLKSKISTAMKRNAVMMMMVLNPANDSCLVSYSPPQVN